MDFEILLLGPIGLLAGGRQDPLGSVKERALLAALAVDTGKAVSSDALVHRLWSGDHPKKPYASLHSYAARLRRRLREASVTAPLVQHAHTYTLAISPQLIDFHRFHQLVEEAHAAKKRSPAAALDALKRAGQLWRGEPLAGLTGVWAEEVRASLEARYLAAQVEKAELTLMAGDFEGAACDLPRLLEKQPSNETIAAYLMTAYYGCGRQADALRLYGDVRNRLREELGADPGAGLERLHTSILRRAPISDLLGPATEPEATPTAPVPDNLPAHADIVGRCRELAVLQELPRDGTVIALQSISGMAGVGKSLLAFHAARKLASAYQDGQLYVNLQAHSASGSALTPSEALGALMRAMGVSASDIPHALEQRTAMWRALLRDRRAVVVLDDAASADQVRPLLPLGSPSLVLITSRQRLTGVPGARPMFLDVLPWQEAVELFTLLIGPGRAQDSQDVARVVALCGSLPLAIELAAGRLRSRPSWSIHHLAQKLAGSNGRLEEIRDRETGVVRAFELSYRTLSQQERTAFRRLGLHLGHTFGPHAAAALIDTPVELAERQVEALLDSSLLSEPEPERYRFHDLLGEYAITLARNAPAECEAARNRLINFYLAAALQADLVVHPRRTRIEVFPDVARDQLPVPTNAQQAKHWLQRETPALIAAEEHARGKGNHRRAAELAHVLAAFFDSEGLWDEAERMHGPASAYWHAQGEHRAEALALIDLGITHAHLGDYAEADVAVRRALALARAAHDLQCTAEALHQLGILHWHRAEYHNMLKALQEALKIRQRSNDYWNQARSKNNMGIAYLHLGDKAAAQNHFQEALLTFQELGDARGEAQALNNLANVHIYTGDKTSARLFFTRALKIANTSGSRSEQAVAQLNLASAMVVPDELDDALAIYQEALSSFQRLGDRRSETITRISLGNALHSAARHEEALEQHDHALALAHEIGAGLEEVQALRGMGTAMLHLGRIDDSRRRLDKALSLARRLASPEEEARTEDALAQLHLAAGHPQLAAELWESAAGIYQDFDEQEAAHIRYKVASVRPPRS
ncbi:AfsR/SARP family transcriptional regulator [Streptomyces albus]|uniref:AfsR/SARP family transcriptional regulator n=1 Tax=Streptomyces albus TaxID=1888 RepID=UPI0006E1EF9A|nr:tetratricopeptide repeat protein [Streptomyces albus]